MTTTYGTLNLGADAARAVDRFNPNGPAGYRAKSGGPIRETREDAEADELANRWTGPAGHRSAPRDAATFVHVVHECDGAHCSRPIRADREVRLGCGCTRWEGDRHDGTRIHLLTGGCSRHEPDAQVGAWNR